MTKKLWGRELVATKGGKPTRNVCYSGDAWDAQQTLQFNKPGTD